MALVWIAFGVLVAKLLVALWSTIASTLWISQRNCAEDLHPELGTQSQIYIVIPLLREQEMILSLLDQFLKHLAISDQLRIIFITTEREEIEKEKFGTSGPTTRDLLSRELATRNFPPNAIIHLHYPEMNTVMAEQLNYALKHIEASSSVSLSKIYFLLYNADSIVDRSAIIAHLRAVQDGIMVAQQSAFFLYNVPRLARQSRFFLGAQGLRQSRWTLQYEIRRYLVSAGELLGLPESVRSLLLVHCVGHGLLIRCDILRQIGGFPIVHIGGEDLALGYVLKVYGYEIKSIPILENAETPDTLREFWKQKMMWFLGPLGYLRYHQLISPSIRTSHRFRIFALSVQGILDALRWILAGPFYSYFLIGAYLHGAFLPALCVYLSYVWLPLIPVLLLWHRQSEDGFPRLTWAQLFLIMAWFPVVPIVHSIPAFASLRVAYRIHQGRPFVRPKTERNKDERR